MEVQSFCDMSKAPEVPTFQIFIEELNRIFSHPDVDVDYVHAVMRAYKSKPAEWKKFRKFDRYK